MHSDRDDYAAGVYPVLTLTLVNTGSTTCRADVGPDTLELRITSGNDRIWSSADCGDAFRAEAVELRRGVPHDVDLTWDRTRSWPDCRDDVVHARPGTYVAKAYSDYEVARIPSVPPALAPETGVSAGGAARRSARSPPCPG